MTYTLGPVGLAYLFCSVDCQVPCLVSPCGLLITFWKMQGGQAPLVPAPLAWPLTSGPGLALSEPSSLSLGLSSWPCSPGLIMEVSFLFSSPAAPAPLGLFLCGSLSRPSLCSHCVCPGHFHLWDHPQAPILALLSLPHQREAETQLPVIQPSTSCYLFTFSPSFELLDFTNLLWCLCESRQYPPKV